MNATALALAEARELSPLESLIEDAGGPEAFAEIWATLSAQDRAAFQYDWQKVARPKQLPPAGKWFTWSLRAGRGFGKTRTGAEFVRMCVEAGKVGRIALVARTAADCRDTMVEGDSGILAVSPPWFMPQYEPSKRRVTWPNGATATTYSADKPGQLRGPQHDLAWCDELAAWTRLRDTWKNLILGMRRGRDPRICITSTPRGLKFLRDLERKKSTAVTHGTTYENMQNLPQTFIDEILDAFQGTRTGEQELNAQILDDNPNAVFHFENISEGRVLPRGKMKDREPGETKLAHAYRNGLPLLDAIGIAVDPAMSKTVTSAETGITVNALTRQWAPPWDTTAIMSRGWTLDDYSGLYRPGAWAEQVVTACEEWETDTVIAEVNQGGDLVEANIKTHPRGKHLKVIKVHATQNKRTRAEPVAGKYEQGRVHHWGEHKALEVQMTQWDPTDTTNTDHEGNVFSPDRLDANVWGLTWALFEFKEDGKYGGTNKPRRPMMPRRI